MASEIGHSIDSVIRDTLAPVLKAAGFRKQARTFRRSVGQAIHVVNAQGSKWNAGAEGQFTLNLGSYWPALAAQLVGPEHVSAAPAEADCHLRQRIGPLLPGGQDHWWTVSPETDLAALGAEVTAAWQAYGAPWFDAVPDLRAAGDRLEQQRSYYWAAAAALADGDRARAAKRVAEGLARNPEGAVLRSWAAQHGLPGDAAAV